MMNKRLLFFVVICAQFVAAGSIIFKHEQILNKGKRYLFKTAPIDPYDAFRGRYVALATDQSMVAYTGKNKFFPKQWIYAVVDVDKDGFASITDLQPKSPEGKDYLKVRYRWEGRNPQGEKTVRIDLPLRRFYMNEKQAPRAEKLYFEYSQARKKDAYIAVRIFKGSAVIEDLFVGGKPISEALAEL